MGLDTVSAGFFTNGSEPDHLLLHKILEDVPRHARPTGPAATVTLHQPLTLSGALVGGGAIGSRDRRQCGQSVPISVFGTSLLAFTKTLL